MGAKRLKLGQVVTAMGAKRLWCEMSWSRPDALVKDAVNALLRQQAWAICLLCHHLFYRRVDQQPEMDPVPTLDQCRANVCDVDTTLIQLCPSLDSRVHYNQSHWATGAWLKGLFTPGYISRLVILKHRVGGNTWKTINPGPFKLAAMLTHHPCSKASCGLERISLAVANMC